MPVVSITLPSQLLKKFDEFMKTRGYYSRSEAFRDALRNLMAEAEIAKIEGEKVATTIMVTRDYARKNVESKISELKHEFDDVVVESLHRHIDKKYCLDIFIAEGDYKRILDLVGRIRGMKGLQQITTMFIPL